MPVKNIVLVPGAWADGSSWSKVIPLLQHKGLHVTAAQNPLSGLAEDVPSTQRFIDAQDGPVLLVGHSYGGAVITEAGVNEKVKGLVYVAAFGPEEGETLGGLASNYPPTPIFPEFRPIADGYVTLSEKGVMESFAPDLPEDERKTIFAVQGATHGSILATPIKQAAWHTRPSWFIVAQHDRVIAPEQEKFTAERMKAKITTLSTGHLPMLVQPHKVADVIISAAASLS